MTKERIKTIADFLYSSNSSRDVPCRISLVAGMAGHDLQYHQLVKFLEILSNSINLHQDLYQFFESLYDNEE